MNLCVFARQKHDGEAEPVPLRLVAGAEQDGQCGGVDELGVAEVDNDVEPLLEEQCELDFEPLRRVRVVFAHEGHDGRRRISGS